MQPAPQPAPHTPLLSFAIPIRNGEDDLPPLLDSLLTQDFSDFEIVISDNASTDRTAEICQEYTRRDSRVRYHRNPENIGLNANFNLLIALARGTYMRWIGSDDRLEPDYARKCMEVLAARPDVIGVTTYQDFVDGNGNRDYYEYKGERLDFAQPHKRYARMIWFMTHDHRYVDPIYTVVRRDVMFQIGGHKAVLGADQVLAVEMSLWGAFAHIPECLAHRGWRFNGGISHEQLLLQNFHDSYRKVSQQTYLNVMAAFWEPVMRLPLSRWEKLLCVPTIIYFFVRITPFKVRDQILGSLRGAKRMLLSYTKA